MIKNKKIALVYDRVNTPHGGAEKVLLALHELFPNAPLFTSVYDPTQARWANVFTVIPSFVNKIPFAKNHHRLLAWLMPLAFESFDFSEYDIIISITSAEAKGIITNTNQTHICYLLTPTRYLYSHKEEHQNLLIKKSTNLLINKLLLGIPAKILLSTFHFLLSYLHWWDQAAKDRPDYIIPISNLVRKRTKKYYDRETEEVVYPPVDIKSFDHLSIIHHPSSINEPYYLIISRLVSYKKIDLAVKACQELGKNLIIIGDGPEKDKLSSIINHKSSTINFLGTVNQKTAQNYLENCQTLIIPAIEDFGITGLEALAAGKPVILQKDSGVAEIIKNKQYGMHIEAETASDLKKAISKSEKTTFDPEKLKNEADQYSTKQFQDRFSRAILQCCENTK